MGVMRSAGGGTIDWGYYGEPSPRERYLALIAEELRDMDAQVAGGQQRMMGMESFVDRGEWWYEMVLEGNDV